MNCMRHSVLLLLIAILHIPLNSTVIVRGNDTVSPFGFTTNITAKVYDRTSGAFFVGLNADGSSPATTVNAFTISRANRPTFTTMPTFKGIAPSTPVDMQNGVVQYMALSPQNNAAPALGVNFSGSSVNTIYALATNGAPAVQSPALNNSFSGTPGLPGAVLNLAASSDYFFAPIFAAPNFGNGANSGVALVSLSFNQSGTPILTTKDATTGMDGNRAQVLNTTSTFVKGSLGGGNVTFSTTGNDTNRVSIYYDTQFERLYLGLRITTANDTSNNSIGKAVVAGRIGASGELVLEDIVADSAIVAATGATQPNQIVVAKNGTGTAGSQQSLSILHLRVMHTSTGPSYLIVNGGLGTSGNATATVGNQIYALPLVDDPTNVSGHGTLADKTLFNTTTHKYTTPATTAGSILDVSVDLVQQHAATVGASTLPMPPSNSVADMVVVGDTVYISIAAQASATTDTGIFYSQALFDEAGQITRWTPWVKRGVPVNAFPLNLPSDIPHAGPISFFDVDAATGNLWVVDGAQQRVVGVTSWNNMSANSTNNMIDTLNNVCQPCCSPKKCKQICCCSCCALDLHQGTRGFTNPPSPTIPTPTNRYALFGMNDSVIFTLVSTANAAQPDINTPQTVTNDFTLPQNFLQTTLPDGAGYPRVLEYSRRALSDTPADSNYFFAGTNTGLFVFAQPGGAGVAVNTLGTLNAAPFTTGSWQKIPSITGAVVDIKTSGNKLYVLTFEVINNPTSPMMNKLFAFTFTNNIATMFASPVLLAQTQSATPFDTIQQFFGIQIISTGDPAVSPTAKEQLILATNQGLFKSNADQTANNGIIDATNQATANWTLIANSQQTMFIAPTGIDSSYNSITQTVWPISVEDKDRCTSFARGGIYQLSGTGNVAALTPPPAGGAFANINTFVPADFNALSTAPQFETLNPTTYLWSDGARRIFITKSITQPGSTNFLTSLPFDVSQWNINSPQNPIANPNLQNIENFFWVKQIGVTGFLLAGTNHGIIGLQ
jgi:hypothetical protein